PLNHNLMKKYNKILCLSILSILKLIVCSSLIAQESTVVMDKASNNQAVTKSMILFTQTRSATPENIERYKANGIFWGHMPHRSIESDEQMERWVIRVQNYTSDGRNFIGRGEFDWGWMWQIDFMEDVDSYWAKDLNGDNISWRGEGPYNGHYHNWQSHHGPEFLEFLKYQVDRMLLARVTQIMFDSQTSATRTLHWKGGDFSPYALEGFRKYLTEKYTAAELSDLGIENISSFNYREFLLDKGFTLESYIEAAKSIEGNIPLYKDFVYFNRESLNDQMEKVFAYIDTKRPGIEIGATTNLVEPRGYIFTDRLTYLAGEYGHPYDVAESPPFRPILHYKAAEATNKTLIYFPYPDAIKALRDRNAPRQARAWIAQAYAMGSIFTIPGNAWIGGRDSWDPGWENHADIYSFIHDNRALIDDYKALSNVGLVYSVYASLLEEDMHGSKTALKSVEYLIKQNISFDLLIFGDPARPIAPTAGQLKKYNVIVHDSDFQYLSSEQDQLLEGVASRLVSFEDRDNIFGNLPAKIDVLKNNEVQNDLISALPRISSKPDAPYVLHLLNRKYNPEEDKAQQQKDISVKITTGLFPEPIIGARLHEPGKTSRDLTLQTDNLGNLILEIGTFEPCWGLVELKH
ncbi:hypothetical protein ACFLSP_04820, partial [Bacteroidota bacterium]